MASDTCRGEVPGFHEVNLRVHCCRCDAIVHVALSGRLQRVELGQALASWTERRRVHMMNEQCVTEIRRGGASGRCLLCFETPARQRCLSFSSRAVLDQLCEKGMAIAYGQLSPCKGAKYAIIGELLSEQTSHLGHVWPLFTNGCLLAKERSTQRWRIVFGTNKIPEGQSVWLDRCHLARIVTYPSASGLS